MFWLAIIILFGADGSVDPRPRAFPTEAACRSALELTLAGLAERHAELGIAAVGVVPCAPYSNPVTAKDA